MNLLTRNEVFYIFVLILASLSCYAEPVKIDSNIIAYIESSNNPLAYNKRTGAKGLYQIVNICLEDYNNYHAIKYNEQDLFDERINFIV